jgi:lambda repressor-like predicted transcriptional regulator
MIDRTPKPCHHPVANHRHGTYACYTLDACRCLPCAFACSTYLAELRAIHANGERTMVAPDAAADHIASLLVAGWTLAAIARVSGVGVTTLQRINSQNRRPDRIKADIETAILTVQDDGKQQRYMISAVGVVRRIRALATLGWSFREIGRRAGVTQHSIVDMNIGVIRNVRPDTYAAICRVYDDLWDQPAPERRDGTTRRMIRYAAKHEWAPPLAWDDESIDDPNAEPTIDDDLGTLRRNLYRQGLSDSEIARRTGVTRETIRMWRGRVGLEPNYRARGRTA